MAQAKQLNNSIAIENGDLNWLEIKKRAEDLLKSGCKIIEFNILNPDRKRSLSSLKMIARKISRIRYYLADKAMVRVKNLPYCLLKQPESVVYFKNGRDSFIKLPQCKECKYNLRCRGVLEGYANTSSRDRIKPILNLPREVMIEIEARCNLDCGFCFNKNSFVKKKRNIKNKLTNELIKKIINNIKEVGIPQVRFTGGEPLLRKDLWGLAEYAKKKNLEVRLNTNGLLVNDLKMARKVALHFDNVLLPIQYDDISSSSNIGEYKLRAINFLKEANVKVLRVGTVATTEVINNLDRVHQFVKSLLVDKWELYRVISTPNNKRSFTKKNVADLVEGLLKIKKQTGETHYIINAIPFCSYNPTKVNTVAIGADAVDGHERLTIDPRGFAKPIYYMKERIGNPANILACWNHPFMKRMRNLELIPDRCKSCIFLEKCRGGCRFSAFSVHGDYKKPDPLMKVTNIKRYLFN